MNNAKTRPSKPALGGAGAYVALGWQLAFSFMAFAAIGYGVDVWLDTLPWFLIVGCLFGMLAWFAQIYRLMVEMNQKDKRRRMLKQEEDKAH